MTRYIQRAIPETVHERARMYAKVLHYSRERVPVTLPKRSTFPWWLVGAIFVGGLVLAHVASAATIKQLGCATVTRYGAAESGMGRVAFVYDVTECTQATAPCTWRIGMGCTQAVVTVPGWWDTFVVFTPAGR